jgi:chemotaxis protein methyltransferase CheR
MAMTTEMSWLCKMIRDKSGIVLGEDKLYLLESRLKPVAEKNGFRAINDLVFALRKTEWSPLHYQVIDAMTTNETYFFRDIAPFDALREKLIPDLIKKRAGEKRLHMWCGAASTGQEPYSIMMVLREHFPSLMGWDVKLLATDLSTKVLARCRNARYSQQEIERGLPPATLNRFFTKVGNEWEAKESIRAGIEFRELNLLDSWFNLGRFDIVFMRNVLIYFDVEVKRMLFGKIRKVLAPDGYLLLGGAESPLNIDNQFVRFPYDRGGVYRLLQASESPSVDPKSERYPAAK